MALVVCEVSSTGLNRTALCPSRAAAERTRKNEIESAAQKSAIETGKQLTAAGKSVRYIRSTFVPGEARCMCLFEATGPELVKELNEKAKIPFTRIVEALDLTP